MTAPTAPGSSADREFLDVTLDSLDALVVVVSGDGAILRFNLACERLTGYSEAEVLGRRPLDFLVPPEYVAIARSSHSRVTETGNPYRHEAPWMARDGSRRIIAWTLAPLLAPDGEVRGVVCTGRDVTEQRAWEGTTRESEERSRSVFEQAAVGMGILSPCGAFTRVNRRLCEITGYAAKHLLGLDARSLVYPEDSYLLDHAFEDLSGRGNGESIQVDVRFVRADGGMSWVRASTSVAKGPAGVLSHYIVVVEQVTAHYAAERHEAEERLGASEKRLELALRGADLGIFDWHVPSGEISCNARFEQILGVAPGELPSHIGPLMARVHPEDTAHTRQSMVDHLKQMAPHYESEHRLLTSSGEWRWVLSRGRVMERSADGRAVRVAGTFLDIDERKRAEERLIRQAALIDNARDVIRVMDLQGRLLLWNPSAERVHGWTSDEVLGRLVPDFLFRDRADFDAALTATIATGSWHGEVVQMTRDGREVIIDARWTLLRDEHGAPNNILAIGLDVTGQRKLETQFLRAQRLESIGTLAGGMAHDLNNVLSPILMSVDLMRTGVDDAERDELLTVVESSARRGAWLVRQVLSFARGMDGQRLGVKPAELLGDLQKLIADTFPKDIDVSVELEEPLPVVMGDPTQLHQVLLNLCLNARDAMPEGGRLSLRARLAMPGPSVIEGGGRFLEIVVADTGSGIPAALHDQIFDPFFTTKEVGKGTGLGLSTVAAIMRGHGGYTLLESEPGRGATFTIYLPIPAAGDASPMSPAPPQRTLPPLGQGQLLLVVDDEAAVMSVVTQTLEAAGYRTVSASNGAEAVAIFAANPDAIAAVVTDMIMPVMDGLATLHALRRLRPDVRVVAVSGDSSEGATARDETAGFAGFLAKPFGIDDLLRLVGEVLADPVD